MIFRYIPQSRAIGVPGLPTRSSLGNPKLLNSKLLSLNFVKKVTLLKPLALNPKRQTLEAP